jgi:hypothetical protein
MTPQQVVGYNARILRIKSGLTQKQVAELLTPLLTTRNPDGSTSGVRWDKTRVAKMEDGRLRYHNSNDLLLSELLALSWLYRVSVIRLLAAPPGVKVAAIAGPGARHIDTPDSFIYQHFLNPRRREHSHRSKDAEALTTLPHPDDREPTPGEAVGFVKLPERGAVFDLDEQLQAELEPAWWLRDMLDHRRASAAQHGQGQSDQATPPRSTEMPTPRRRENGRWSVVYRDPSGRQRRRDFRLKSDADAFVHAIETSKVRGEWTDPALGKIQPADEVESWLRSRLDLKPSTLGWYKGILTNHVVNSDLGTRQLASLTRDDVRRWVADLTKTHSPRTVRAVHRALAAMLEAGVADGKIPRNPARGIKTPKAERKETPGVSPEDVERLAQAMPERYATLARTPALTGLRFGEATALRVQDLDLKAGRLSVRQAVYRVKGKPRIGEPRPLSRPARSPCRRP